MNHFELHVEANKPGLLPRLVAAQVPTMNPLTFDADLEAGICGNWVNVPLVYFLF